jgi:hypothetical protein
MKRGLKAGILTFLLFPIFGGSLFGFVGAASFIIVSMKDHSAYPFSESLIALLLTPIAMIWGSFSLIAAPLALAATYVAIRVGMTGRMSWAETIILLVMCLALIPGATHSIFDAEVIVLSSGYEQKLWLSPWMGKLMFLFSGLLAALALRYLAGRRGLA